MEQKVIRTLRADEIECRVGTISEKGVSLLLYKDARCDMRILDEVFGANNWQREHLVIAGNLYCKVSIWDSSKKQWIFKMDVGTKSNSESKKGEASDSFKRACVSLGIGRELYTAPFIWVTASDVNITKKQDKFITYDNFSVQSITYSDNREITELVIINQQGKVVYEYADRAANNTQDKAASTEKKDEVVDRPAEVPQEDMGSLTGQQITLLQAELTRTGVTLEKVLQRYGLTSLQNMGADTYKKAMTSLKRTKAAA